jgi:hypothetical protein
LQGICKVNACYAAVLLRQRGKRSATPGTVLVGKEGMRGIFLHGFPYYAPYPQKAPAEKRRKFFWKGLYMSDTDGIQISDKPSWEHTGKELFAILGKRLIALPSKMLGFKPFCLYLATWLLTKGLIRDWIWFAVCVMVLFGIVGLKVISRMKNE